MNFKNMIKAFLTFLTGKGLSFCFFSKYQAKTINQIKLTQKNGHHSNNIQIGNINVTK